MFFDKIYYTYYTCETRNECLDDDGNNIVNNIYICMKNYDDDEFYKNEGGVLVY